MPQDPTELQQQASRQNGALSHGPVTEEGKAHSSQNAIKHGLNSRRVVLVNESQSEYGRLLAAYRAEWNPQGQSENDLVRDIVDARWRIERIKAMETAAMDAEIFVNRKPLDAIFTVTTPELRQTDALQVMGAEKNNFLDKLDRFELRYTRIYERAIKALVHLQKLRGTGLEQEPRHEQPSPGQNEPEKQSTAEPLRTPSKPKHRRNHHLPPVEIQPATETFHWETTYIPPADQVN